MMMSLKSYRSIPRRTVIVHLSWLGSLLLFILAVIVPVQRFAAGLDGRIKDIRYQVDEQKRLQPIYQMLKTKTHTTAPGILPMPAGGKLSRDLVSVVPSTIGRIVKNAAMETISISPDVTSLANQSRSLLMHAVIRGDFMNFRKFLIGIGELPYLERFEEIEIQKDPDFMEFRMKIRLALN
ncbi:MAG: hypothetical protein JXL20_10845 [Deltaproteobacteria bacterium]|nr:hypothetical protein [Deltaproteobacteria bacterium]